MLVHYEVLFRPVSDPRVMILYPRYDGLLLSPWQTWETITPLI
jgi:hypothetical protein